MSASRAAARRTTSAALLVVLLLSLVPGTATAAGVVRLEVGDDFQAVVDRHPPGTTYQIAAGVHREQQVVAEDGDRFIGEPGAVLSGARDLSGAAWTRGGGGWYVGGQSQEGFVHGTLLPGGNARDVHPEELFVDGQRWRHVASPAELGPGTWHFDYAADRIVIGQDPAQLGRIETSTTSGAFGGDGVRGVVIENLEIRQYATPSQHGAIGFFGQHNTYDWTIRDVVVVDNHGAGIRLAPGMVVESSVIARNGQIGLGGSGEHVDGSGRVLYAAPVTVRGSEIAHNRLLDFDWGWEGGAMKVKWTPAGSLIEGNWVHHNGGPGIWHDIENVDAVIRGNLVEDNEQAGIFYEISHGTSLIEGNYVRRNGLTGVGDEGAGIDISNSTGVTVRANLVEGNRHGILIRDDGRAPGLHDVLVTGNDVRLVDDRWTIKARDVAAGQGSFTGNRYYGTDRAAYQLDDMAMALPQWVRSGLATSEGIRPAAEFPAWTGTTPADRAEAPSDGSAPGGGGAGASTPPGHYGRRR